MSTEKKQYIFRWKDENIEVTPSRRDTPEEVWEWAEIALRGCTESALQARRNVHKYGEVVEFRP